MENFQDWGVWIQTRSLKTIGPDPVCPERLDPDPICPERFDPDPVCTERLDPDPVKIILDPQPCLQVTFSLTYF